MLQQRRQLFLDEIFVVAYRRQVELCNFFAFLPDQLIHNQPSGTEVHLIDSVRESLLPAAFEKDAHRSWRFYRRLLLLWRTGPSGEGINRPFVPINALMWGLWTMTLWLDTGQPAGGEIILLASEVGERIAAQPYRVFFDHGMHPYRGEIVMVVRSYTESGTSPRRRKQLVPTVSRRHAT